MARRGVYAGKELLEVKERELEAVQSTPLGELSLHVVCILHVVCMLHVCFVCMHAPPRFAWMHTRTYALQP